MSTQLAPLSACVTRILSVSGFPKELRTKDINQAFSDWDNVSGGFKIKWKDDTSLYVVFNDAAVAKRAYLQALHTPPTAFVSSPSSPKSNANGSPGGTENAASSRYTGTKIRPYNGPDAQQIIQSAMARGNGHARGHSSHKSISVGGGAAGAHARMGSNAGSGFRNGNGNGNGREKLQGQPEVIQEISIPGSNNTHQGLGLRDREPSPTLPNLPQQPTLNALISSSLSPDHLTTVTEDPLSSAGAANATNSVPVMKSAPRVGDPGRRMVAHSLGVKHPGLNRSLSGDELSSRMKELQRDVGGMAIAE